MELLHHVAACWSPGISREKSVVCFPHAGTPLHTYSNPSLQRHINLVCLWTVQTALWCTAEPCESQFGLAAWNKKPKVSKKSMWHALQSFTLKSPCMLPESFFGHVAQTRRPPGTWSHQYYVLRGSFGKMRSFWSVLALPTPIRTWSELGRGHFTPEMTTVPERSETHSFNGLLCTMFALVLKKVSTQLSKCTGPQSKLSPVNRDIYLHNQHKQGMYPDKNEGKTDGVSLNCMIEAYGDPDCPHRDHFFECGVVTTTACKPGAHHPPATNLYYVV